MKAICGYGCASCTTANNCNYCISGYYLNGSICVQCMSHCSVCHLVSSSIIQNNTNVTVQTITCLLCSSGRALVDNSCVQCTDVNCISCDFNTQFCIQCAVTYVADSSGICISCAKNCDFCDVDGAGTCDVDSCSVGYTRYNSTVCLPCMKGCSSCNNIYPFSCIGCLVGTYNSSGVCVNCPIGCYSCSSGSSCNACI